MDLACFTRDVIIPLKDVEGKCNSQSGLGNDKPETVHSATLKYSAKMSISEIRTVRVLSHILPLKIGVFGKLQR